MLRNIPKNIELGVRWLTLTAVVVFLVEELIRVLWYIIGQWGVLHAFVDGAVLYKVGEIFIIIPFLIFVHWNGIWDVVRLEKYVHNAKWVIWVGGILNFVAAFDLFGRVDWAWWTVLLMIFSLFSPFMLKSMARKKAKWKGRIAATSLFVLFLFHYAIGFILSGYFIAPLSASHPSPAASEHGRWQQDSHYLATELPRLHLNAFHTIDKQHFEEEVAKLNSAIPNLQTNGIKVGLQKLVAMIGDAHTGFDFGNFSIANRLPLELYWLSDGLFVTGADEEYRGVIGARVISIGSLTVDSAFDVVCTLIPNESEGLLLDRSTKILTAADKLYYLSIADNIDSVRFVLKKKDGDTIAFDISPRSENGKDKLHYLPEEIPLYRTDSDTEYWSKYFKDINTLYLKYNLFFNPISFPSFSNEFWQMVKDSSVEYVVVDFRDNTGGYSGCFDRFFECILDDTNINRKNHLYVLVNRGSFSSASLYAAIIRRETNAILVGEEMGGGLNRYGDVRSFKLPNSGVRVSYSVQYFELWPDSLPQFRIDIPITPSSKEYFAGRDPVLDSVIQLIKTNIGNE